MFSEVIHLRFALHHSDRSIKGKIFFMCPNSVTIKVLGMEGEVCFVQCWVEYAPIPRRIRMVIFVNVTFTISKL